MLINLVRRLPVMLLPAWVQSKTHSVDIENVCQAFELCLQDASLIGGTYDLGGHQPLTYREMIRQTAKLLGKRAHFVHFPYNCFGLSKHWVSVLAECRQRWSAPCKRACSTIWKLSPSALSARLEGRWVSFEQSFRKSVDAAGMPRANPRRTTQASDRKHMKQAKRVRSVQRMPLPLGWSAQQVATEYGEWLGRRFGGLINAAPVGAGVVRLTALAGRVVLLELTPTPYSQGSAGRCAFYITGGKLSRDVDPPGRLEFRLFPERGCLIASIHGFAPTLPWWIYANTQARMHLYVMRAFGRYLQQIAVSAK